MSEGTTFPENFRKKLPQEEYEAIQREMRRRAESLIPVVQELNKAAKSAKPSKEAKQRLANLEGNPIHPKNRIEVDGTRYLVAKFRRNDHKEGDDFSIVAWSEVKKYGVPVYVPMVIYPEGNWDTYFTGLKAMYPQWEPGLDEQGRNLAHINNFVKDLIDRSHVVELEEPADFATLLSE